MTGPTQPQTRLLIGDDALAGLNDMSTVDRLNLLLDQGLPPEALSLYANRLAGDGATMNPAGGVGDLVFVLIQFRSSAYSAGMEDIQVFDYVAHMLVAVLNHGTHPEPENVKATIMSWGKRRIGWLGEAAGFTPAEYDTATPDLDTLAILAALRHGPVLHALAQDLA